MKKLKKLLILTIWIFAFTILNNIPVNASSSDLYLNNLDFQAQINIDGSMDVTEKWNIEIEDTNTLYKTFNIDSTKYSNLTNVIVKDITGGKEKTLEESYQWYYHMPEGTYFGGLNKDGKNEIAWGVGLEDSKATKSYLISYHITDAIAKYSDYAELYWQFIGKDFEVNAKKITGTIKLPNDTVNSEEIKVWGHTEDLNGEIYANNNEIEFEINNFRAGRYVEIRSLFPTEMISYTNRTSNIEILPQVLKEETKWANEANARRTKKKIVNTIITILSSVVASIAGIFGVKSIIKYNKEIKEIKKIEPSQKIEYFREIPRKDATPAEALAVYKKVVGSFDSSVDIGRIFSATLLHLSLKKYIEFEQQEKNTKIRLLKKEIGDDLRNSTDEIEIFKFLKGIFDKQEQNEVDVKDIKKYIKSKTSKVIKLKENIDKNTEETLYKKNLANKQNKERKEKISGSLAVSIFSIIALFFISAFIFGEIVVSSMILMIIAIILFCILVWKTITVSRLLKKIEVLTQQGIDEQEEWKGLKKFMEDFSMLDKREVPELILWEEFLVYATAFGIANKVLKQLKTVYPNFNEQIDASTYGCMYLMMNTDFSTSFSNSISSAMSTSYSSASGGGGGFSGGGGGRWPEVAGGGGR